MDEAEKLKTWAIKEMKIPGLTHKSDVSYICRGDLIPLWEYLRENVKHTTSAEKIRGNLLLHSLQSSQKFSSDNLHSKVQQYQQLLRQVTQQRLEVAEVEENIALQQQKLTNLSRMGNHEKSQHRDQQIKTLLLSRQREVTIYNQSQMFVNFKSSLEQYLTKYNLDSRSCVELDFSSGRSKHFKKMRDSHQAICRFLDLLLLGSLSKQQLQAEKDKIKAELRDIMSAVGSKTVLEYIIHDVNRSREKIDEATQTIDYIKDAENLRFRVVSDGLVDESSEPSLNSGVTQLIEEAQVEHQQRFLETELCRAESVELNHKLSDLKASLLSKITASLPDKDPKLKIIKDILDNRIAERQTKAALKVVRSTCSALEHQVQGSQKQTAKLKQKERDINNFKRNVHSQQNQICVLMKQNVGAKSKLDDRQGLLVETINTLVSNAEPLASLNSTTVTEDYTKEVKKFHLVPLYSLSSNPHSVVTGRLSDGSKDVQQLSQLLGFSGYKSTDAVVRSVRDKQLEVLQSHTYLPPPLVHSEAEGVIATLKDHLLPEAKKKNQDVIRELQPVIERSKGVIERSSKRCDKVDTLIDEWWKQPALHLNINSAE